MDYEIDEITSVRLSNLETSMHEISNAIESLNNDVRATELSITNVLGYSPGTLTTGQLYADQTPNERWVTTYATISPDVNFNGENLNEIFKSWLNNVLQEAKQVSGKELYEINLEDFDKILRGEYEAN